MNDLRKFYNGNDLFGESGPFYAESLESLVSDMSDTFRQWAVEALHRGDQRPIQVIVDEMADEFMRGIEDVTDHDHDHDHT